MITQDDLAKIVADKTGYYKKDIQDVLRNLEEAILECMQEDEVKLFKGVYFGTEKTKKRIGVTTPDGGKVNVPPYLKSYVRYTDTFREQFKQ